ncbi:hypothetical protein COY62_04115 [bacterium (Candidatus Howlettbacteria) CG_4_10_14_0_8_um_filter_40_9]|nr:MAG: hypothetical protein COY62_04115 [bacterium (Candidatus Howlettbacteria) CG_4_10_14_0_8_um_filter_40_9]
MNAFTKQRDSTAIMVVVVPLLILALGYLVFGGNTNNSQQQDKHDAGKYSTSVYFNQVVDVYANVADAITQMQFIESYWPNWSNSDVAELAKQTMIIETSYAKIASISPPDDLTSIHQEVLSAFILFRDAMPMYRKAIDSRDTALRTESMNMILRAGEELTAITNKFE